MQFEVDRYYNLNTPDGRLLARYVGEVHAGWSPEPLDRSGLHVFVTEDGNHVVVTDDMVSEVEERPPL